MDNSQKETVRVFLVGGHVMEGKVSYEDLHITILQLGLSGPHNALHMRVKEDYDIYIAVQSIVAIRYEVDEGE